VADYCLLTLALSISAHTEKQKLSLEPSKLLQTLTAIPSQDRSAEPLSQQAIPSFFHKWSSSNGLN